MTQLELGEPNNLPRILLMRLAGWHLKRMKLGIFLATCFTIPQHCIANCQINHYWVLIWQKFRNEHHVWYPYTTLLLFLASARAQNNMAILWNPKPKRNLSSDISHQTTQMSDQCSAKILRSHSWSEYHFTRPTRVTGLCWKQENPTNCEAKPDDAKDKFVCAPHGKEFGVTSNGKRLFYLQSFGRYFKGKFWQSQFWG